MYASLQPWAFSHLAVQLTGKARMFSVFSADNKLMLLACFADDSNVLLSFYYLIALEIVTVSVKLTMPPESSGSGVVCGG